MNRIKWLVGLIVLLVVQMMAAVKADVHIPFGSSEGTIQPDKVFKAHIGEQLIRSAVIVGGAAGNLTVTGIAVGDNLIGVIRLNRDATAANIDMSGITSEFTITAANTINNAGGTNTTGDALLILYQDNT